MRGSVDQQQQQSAATVLQHQRQSARHSLFSRQRTSSVERELASTPYAFTPKPPPPHLRLDLDLDVERRLAARDSLLNPFEDDINVRLAKQRLFGSSSRAASPSLYGGVEEEERLLRLHQLDALSNISERSGDGSTAGDLSRVNSEELPGVPEVLPPIRAEVTHLDNDLQPLTALEARRKASDTPKRVHLVDDDDDYDEDIPVVKVLETRRKPSDTPKRVRLEERPRRSPSFVVDDDDDDSPPLKVIEARRPLDTPKRTINAETVLVLPLKPKPPQPPQEDNDSEENSRRSSSDSSEVMQGGLATTTGTLDAFTVLQATVPPPPPSVAVADDLDSVSSSLKSSCIKLSVPVKAHRVSSFAIVGEPAEPTAIAKPSTDPKEPNKPPSIASSTGRNSSTGGRVSPFRGKGFKPDPNSAFITPRSSPDSSPQRSDSPPNRTTSFERPPTPPKNFIEANIREVRELSKFNRERNEDLAQQKRVEEELEILKELGLIGDTKTIGAAKLLEIRSKMTSPSVVLHYENVRRGTQSSMDNYDTYDIRPRRPAGRTTGLKSLSKSQPQSKTGSPQHRSKIPKRQQSMSPPPKHEVMEHGVQSSMSNVISADGRFISNSTGSIYEKRAFGPEDYDNLPFEYKTRSQSRSTYHLGKPISILKSKPPKGQHNLGPPPTSKGNAKRLSPIVSTPDMSGASSARKGVKSKTPTPRVSSPSKIPKRPSKSLAASPTQSRAPSRATSRSNLVESGTLQKSSSTAKLSSGQRTMDSGFNSRRDSRDSGGKKPPLTRINSRSSVTSKTSGGSKPELKRGNSRSSMLSRTNSIMSINDKSGTLKRKPSLKNLKESSVDGKSLSSSEGRTRKQVMKRDVSTSRSTNDVDTDIEKQDNETQYDKERNADGRLDKLIHLTKGNVMSMTTAAITSQPLEIAAKVTSQLPTTFEKAREKGVFDRNSSSDSLAPAKLDSDKVKSDDDKEDAKTKLQKTASKTSLGSVKEEKETKAGPIIQNNMKLIPLDKANMDPKLEKVKKKIDNILKSDQSSVVDLKEKLEKDADKVSSTLEKVAEKIEEEVKISTTTAIIEKAAEEKKEKEETTKKGPSLLSATSSVKTMQGMKKMMDGKPEEKPKETPAAEKAAEKNPEKVVEKAPEKAVAPVEKPPPTKAESPPKETTPPKQPSPPTQPKAELVMVKEMIKKDTLEVVNEKTLGKSPVEGGEKVTEAIIKGEPDVEVQSGNVSPAVVAPSKLKPSPNGAKAGGTSAGAVNGVGTNGTAAGVSNGTSKLPHNDSKESKSKNVLGSPISGKIHKEDVDVEKASTQQQPPEGKPDNICKRFMGKWRCCAKKPNSSEVRLIGDKEKKKSKSKLESKPDDAKESKMSRLNCCKKNNKEGDMAMDKTKVKKAMKKPGEEGEAKPGCLSCCKRKNKIRDSSADRQLHPANNQRWYDKICCCRKKAPKPQDRAMRRDSILSQPAPKDTGCCGGCMSKLICCKKKAPAEDSRRTSLFSKKRSLSQAVPIEDTRNKLDPTMIEHGSLIRGAIPALPIPLAWICCVCNVLIPGLGTILSGMFNLCFGRPRFGMYDGWKPRFGAFMVDIFVGAGQLFTVLFCLVGWGWSIWWGTMMVKVARKYKKLKLVAEDPEKAPPTNNHRAPKA